MRILIVEDEIKIRIGMGKLIESETEHEVIGLAKNGVEGLEMISHYKPDLVITDIKMPEMDGLEMLTNVKENGIRIHAIILTGYAEFEYARKALTLGVKDYLLKPIGVSELKKMLEEMDVRLQEEEDSTGTLESALRDLYLSNQADSKDSYEKLAGICSRKKYTYFQFYLGYVGEAEYSYVDWIRDNMSDIIKRYRDKECVVSYIAKYQEVILLIMEKEKNKEMEELFCRKIASTHMRPKDPVIWSQAAFDHIEGIYEVMSGVSKLQIYGLMVDKMALITSKEVSMISFDKFLYPNEIVQKLKIAICNGDAKKINTETENLVSYMQAGRYHPEKIKQSYIKIYSFLSNLLQEIDLRAYEQLANQYILKKMSEARSFHELEKLLYSSTSLILSTQGKKEDISNYTIKRAINYIREHYKEGITQEELARKLEITPEYLSTLFYREMNVNYSTFLKQFRISHAKRLLKGTEMKIYEIAESVGYSDPKYFIRVFKEVVGQSPKEYRQQN